MIEKILTSHGLGVTLSKIEKQFETGLKTLQNINLTIHPGKFVALVGPSGCGKTTLLRVIAGLETISSGKLSLSSNPTGRISYVFQEPHLIPWRTVFSNVSLPFDLRRRKKGSEEIKSRIQDAIDSVGLTSFENFFPYQLSGGMRMRVSLARALVTRPSLLLMDEPFAALDEVTRFQLEERLWQLWHTLKMTVVFVTHSLSEAAFLSEEVILFSKKTHSLSSLVPILFSKPRDRNLRSDPEFLSAVQNLTRQFETLEES